MDISQATPAARNASQDAAPRALPSLAALDEQAWRDLAGRVIEPNGYYLPEWTLAANGDARARSVTRALTAFDAGSRLTGLLPVLSCWNAYRLPLPVLVSADPFRSLDTPLLDRADGIQAAATLLTGARGTGARALLLRDVARDGDAVRLLTQAAQAEGREPVLLRGWSRACLDATRDSEELLRDALGGKRLKEYRRLLRRLADHREVRFSVAQTPGDVAQGYDVFLALEASGWKGRRGTALLHQPELAARLRQAAVALAGRGACEIALLHAGDEAIAAGIVLRHGDRAYFFKLGIAEQHARSSPGVLLTLELTRHLCADPAIRLVDSTAAPDHPMIDPIWRGRFAVGDVLIPLRTRDPLFAPITAALRAREALRQTAKRLLKR
ncbi:GNAT family N-acetyltransferase [Rhodopseudomonas sp. HC1]|uniref:GNAT family N-acetyltransferase n=1 Tax=Rhodopseudomonas infernalis TaxID=2897386 RepID=UPI001EE981FF|nr:GNAT family N-acetyltransferase [Rhodopseudomonas infernalis]MCG6204559.1 GNAT family N-acetyltransferase [Rhodopseudomonas infernalis]